jgi:hypothetical protein
MPYLAQVRMRAKCACGVSFCLGGLGVPAVLNLMLPRRWCDRPALVDPPTLFRPPAVFGANKASAGRRA